MGLSPGAPRGAPEARANLSAAGGKGNTAKSKIVSIAPQLLRLSKYSKYLGAMAALLALRFIWLIGHDALWNPPPCGGPGFRSDASTEPAHTRHAEREERSPSRLARINGTAAY